MNKVTNMNINIGNGQELLSRKVVVTIILAIALVAFEIFNFDTTQFALQNLLGDIRFAGVLWASILAIAFCAIDFAGLVRIFTPQRGSEEPKAVWFLTGAWFLGTIANSIMTWWAVSLTLLSHEFGNEVLSREALLRYVPIFVAMLVWLTRILFIGAFSAAGEDVVGMTRQRNDQLSGAPRREIQAPLATRPVTARTNAVAQASSTASQVKPVARQPQTASRPASNSPTAQTPITYEPIDDIDANAPAMPKTNGGSPGQSRPTSRIQQRPPMPGVMGRTPTTGNVHARSSKQGH